MDILYLLPNMNQVLSADNDRRLIETLHLIENNITVLGFFLDIQLIIKQIDCKEKYNVLFKIYLMKKQNENAVIAALKYFQCVSKEISSDSELEKFFDQFIMEDNFFNKQLIEQSVDTYIKNIELEKDLSIIYEKYIIRILKNKNIFIGTVVEISSNTNSKNILHECHNVLLKIPPDALKILIPTLNKTFLHNLLIKKGYDKNYQREYIDSVVYFDNIELGIKNNTKYNNTEDLLISLFKDMKNNECYAIVDYIKTVYSKFSIKTLEILENINLKNYGNHKKIANMITILENGLDEIKQHILIKYTKTNFKLLSYFSKQTLSNTESATILNITNGILNLGTLNDNFLRMNIKTLIKDSKKKSNQIENRDVKPFNDYNDFLNKACLGLVHYKNRNIMKILTNLLPNLDNADEGGIPFALGISHAGMCNFNLVSNNANIAKLEEMDNETLSYTDSVKVCINYIYNTLTLIVTVNNLENTKTGTFSRETIVGSIKGLGFLLAEAGSIEKQEYENKTDGNYLKNYISEFENTKESHLLETLVKIALMDEDFYSDSALITLGQIYSGTCNIKLVKIISPLLNSENNKVKDACIKCIGMVLLTCYNRIFIDDMNLVEFIINILDRNNFNESFKIYILKKMQSMKIIKNQNYTDNASKILIEQKFKYFNKIVESIKDENVTEFLIMSIASLYACSGNINIIQILMHFSRDLDEKVRIISIQGMGMVSISEKSNKWDECNCRYYTEIKKEKLTQTTINENLINNYSEEANYLPFEILKPFLSSPDAASRSTAALAMGYCHSGVGSYEMLDILQNGLSDYDDIMVQSTCIAIGLLLNQNNDMTVCRKLDKENSEAEKKYLKLLIELDKIGKLNKSRTLEDTGIPLEIENVTKKEINEEKENIDSSRRMYSHTAFSQLNDAVHDIYMNSTSLQRSCKLGSILARGFMNVSGRNATLSLYKYSKPSIKALSSYIILSDPHYDFEKYLYIVFMLKETNILVLSEKSNKINGHQEIIQKEDSINFSKGFNFSDEEKSIEHPDIFTKVEYWLRKKRRRKIDNLDIKDFNTSLLPSYVLYNSTFIQNEIPELMKYKTKKIDKHITIKNGIASTMKELESIGFDDEQPIFLEDTN